MKGQNDLTQMTDEELIDGCIREERVCQKELYQRYSNKLFALSLRYCNTRPEAEDVLHEAFIKIFDNLGSFKKEGSFEGWMKRIVINTALSSKDKKIYKREKMGLEDYQAPEVDPSVLKKLASRDLMDLVHKMPEGYREVFNLFAVEGYSHKEISQMLEIAESTSRSQYIRARKYMQKLIQEHLN